LPGIFISYRREDTSGYAGRVFDLLSDHFGRERTFMDLDTIRGGDDFTVVIEEKVANCDVLLAVIGPKWLSCVGVEGTRRLDQADDFVRLEIANAIERGVRVVPVLVGGGAMPQQDELPPDLRPLALRQAVELRDAYFRADTERLIGLLSAVSPARSKPWRRGSPMVWAVVAAALVIAALAGGFLLLRRGQPAAVAVPQQAKAAAPEAAAPVKEASRANASPASTAPARVAESPAAQAMIAGTWKATVKYDWPGAVYVETFNFVVDGRDVSGSASFLELGRGIFDGKLDGNRISFITKTESVLDDQTSEDIHSYKGKLDGNTIRFSMLTDSKMDSHVPVYFAAVRASAK
jgi:hypothetical protein